MSDYMYNSYYIWSWATLQGYLHIIDKLLEAATLKWKVGARSIQGLPLCSARLQIEYHLMMASKSPLQNGRYILRVAGWKLIITGKPLVLKRNAQVVDLPWLLHDAVYNHSERWLPPKCQTGRSDGRRVYFNDFKPVMNYCFWRNIWNIIWIICWIWFLPCEYQNENTLSLC